MAMALKSMSATPLRSSAVSRQRVAPISAAVKAKSAPAKAPAKGKAAKETYVCLDCGYVYTGDFAALPANYKCPVCNSPKRRFVAKGSAAEADGDADLIIKYGGAAVVLLGALYFVATNR